MRVRKLENDYEFDFGERKESSSSLLERFGLEERRAGRRQKEKTEFIRLTLQEFLSLPDVKSSRNVKKELYYAKKWREQRDLSWREWNDGRISKLLARREKKILVKYCRKKFKVLDIHDETVLLVAFSLWRKHLPVSEETVKQVLNS